MPTPNAWPPHITVATVVQRENAQRNAQFLFVEEQDDGRTVFNQPAGHLDPGESLLDAAIRETLEETAWQVSLTGFVGLYHYYSEHNDTTYLRVCFTAQPIRHTDLALDSDIIAAHWLTREELQDLPMRSPLVQLCLDDALN